MTNNTYIIEYICYSKSGIVLQEGKMRVKNRPNDFTAKCDLEDFLRRKYENFGRMVVCSCKIDGGIDDMFNSLFGDNNPFKF